MSYLCYLCSSLPSVVCRRAHVLFLLCVLFVGGLMFYLRYLCLSLPSVVCRRAHVLFMLFVFVFTSSCL